MMACTATASRSVKKEIIDNLEMSGCVEVTASLDRPNVCYEMKPRTDIAGHVCRNLRSFSSRVTGGFILPTGF